MNLTRFPRRRYTPGPTALEPARRLSEALGFELWIKRDDELGLAGGGNKTRKLEFLVADALERGCDTLVTTGAAQSNHVRLTAAAAAREGLKCRVLIEERTPGSYSANGIGNLMLNDLLGVERVEVLPGGSDLAAGMERLADGARAYVIPGGGSNPVGELGYVACALELRAQTTTLGLAFDRIVVASGSAGTHAGLLVGITALGWEIEVLGVSIRRTEAEQVALVHRNAIGCATLLGVAPPPRERVMVDDRWVGPGYAHRTDAMVEAVRMTAALEGVLLDPVYTGKAMAGLIGRAREGALPGRTLFLHTGGAAALSAFRDWF